jgi:23S rRNA pseudouridine1911/1915/1917 synthase
MNKTEIVFENENFAIINKPVGLVVNRSDTTKGITLQDFIEENILNLEDFNPESEFYLRSGIVHRLDKDTSGLLIVAKNENYLDYLQEKFRTREVEKKYIVMTFNKVLDERFEIDAPLARNPKNRFKYAVVRDGKEAQTYFEKIKDVVIDEKEFSFLYAQPRTGRTHQIRVHLAANSTPVAGDVIYLSEKEHEICISCTINRLMLHSLSLKFQGLNGEEFYFEADVPEEFIRLME